MAVKAHWASGLVERKLVHVCARGMQSYQEHIEPAKRAKDHVTVDRNSNMAAESKLSYDVIRVR